MAQVQRNDHSGDPLAPPAAEHRYEAGGPIGELQADLARRLAAEEAAPALPVPAPPAERLVRLLSVAGGYTALLAGYAAVGLAIAWWM